MKSDDKSKCDFCGVEYCDFDICDGCLLMLVDNKIAVCFSCNEYYCKTGDGSLVCSDCTNRYRENAE